MSDEQWLRDGLDAAVPDPPANPDRARAAERLARRRRRTTAAGALGAVGMIAGAAALAAALTGGDGGSGDTQVADTPPVACPEIEFDVDGTTASGSALDEPDPDAPSEVPGDPTSARICQGPGSTYRVPAEPVADPAALAAQINALRPNGPPEICTMDLGPGFRIVFGYADGSSFVVSAKAYGCREVVVGSGYRASDPALWDTLATLSGVRTTP